MRIYKLRYRRAKNAALGETHSSRGWKLLSAANRLPGR